MAALAPTSPEGFFVFIGWCFRIYSSHGRHGYDRSSAGPIDFVARRTGVTEAVNQAA